MGQPPKETFPPRNHPKYLSNHSEHYQLYNHTHNTLLLLHRKNCSYFFVYVCGLIMNFNIIPLFQRGIQCESGFVLCIYREFTGCRCRIGSSLCLRRTDILRSPIKSCVNIRYYVTDTLGVEVVDASGKE